MHKTHVALLSSPGLGHLFPVIELGKLLALHCNFKVTIMAITSHTSEAESHVVKSALSLSINFCDILQIPPADISGLLQNDAAAVERICVIMRETKGSLRSALSNMAHPPSALIVDIFGSECLSIAEELGMAKYIFVASSAWFFSLLLYSPVLDKHVQGQFVDQKQPFEIPGCNPVRPEDVVDPMLDRNNRQYQEYIGMAMGMRKGDGILVNTWEQLQYKELHSLRDENLLGGMLKVPVYAIGPVVREPEPPTSSTMELLSWLDQQPCGSVVYVSFGSGGTLSYEQTMEVAWGLEMSQLRFIWVVRPPNKRADSVFFSTSEEERSEKNDPFNYLPKGFKERTHKVGKLVPQWAAQASILRHPSVGGFMSHCGWSSVLESVTNGVPMICWPLYAEQRMNATLVAEELRVGVRPEVLPEKKVVGREEIVRMLKEIIVEGKPNPIRERVKEVKESAAMAMKIGGSSFTALHDFAKTVLNRKTGSPN